MTHFTDEPLAWDHPVKSGSAGCEPRIPKYRAELRGLGLASSPTIWGILTPYSSWQTPIHPSKPLGSGTPLLSNYHVAKPLMTMPMSSPDTMGTRHKNAKLTSENGGKRSVNMGLRAKDSQHASGATAGLTVGPPSTPPTPDLLPMVVA